MAKSFEVVDKKYGSLYDEWSKAETFDGFSYWLTEKIIALESTLSAQAQPKIMTAAEWAALSPESRHNLNMIGADVDALCNLVLRNTGGLSLILQRDREQIIALANKLAGGDTDEWLSASPMESMFGTHEPGMTGVFVVEDDANQNAHFRAVDGDTIK